METGAVGAALPVFWRSMRNMPSYPGHFRGGVLYEKNDHGAAGMGIGNRFGYHPALE